MKKKQGMSVSIGFSTMLLIFVVISLVSFSVLSLSSAVTDQKFTENIKIKNLTYYNACNMAEEEIGIIDAALARAYASCESKEAYFNEVSHESLIQIPVSEYQELQVVLKHLYPLREGDAYYEITKYSLVNINSPEIDEGLHVIRKRQIASTFHF